MMHCDSANPVIRKAINDYMTKDSFSEMETCYDTDNVNYKVWGNEESKQFYFAYRGNDSKKILENGGREMIQELYGNYMLEENLWDPNYDITLKIDGGNLPKTQKVKKTMTEEEQEKVRDSNELVRNERKTIV